MQNCHNVHNFIEEKCITKKYFVYLNYFLLLYYVTFISIISILIITNH